MERTSLCGLSLLAQIRVLKDPADTQGAINGLLQKADSAIQTHTSDVIHAIKTKTVRLESYQLPLIPRMQFTYSPRALETARGGSRIGREWASVGARVS